MPEKRFDIESLLTFHPPKYFCEKCYGLITKDVFGWPSEKIECPICGVEYVPTEEYNKWEAGKYLSVKNLEIKFSDIIAHSRILAGIARRAKYFLKSKKEKIIYNHDVTPMRALLSSLCYAQNFVHFITFGISTMFLGALKLAAQSIDVRGIISNIDNKLVDELTNYNYEAPKLDLKIFGRGGEKKKGQTMPHQKIIIIDGLMGFKGSANLTIPGWRKATEKREIIEVVTDVKEVIELNNQFFSPIWAEFSDINDKIEMQEAPF